MPQEPIPPGTPAVSAAALGQDAKKNAKAKRVRNQSSAKRAYLERVKADQKQKAPTVPSATTGPVKRLSILNFADLFRSSPSARVELIRTGVSAGDVKRLQRQFDMPQQVFLTSMKLSTATVNRKVSHRESLSPQDSERVIGIAKLVGQVQEMVEQSGDASDFNAAKWLAGWLQQPVQALGGARPIDYMDTMEGQGMVSEILARMQSGAYS